MPAGRSVGRSMWDSTIARAHQHAAGARPDPDSQNEPPGAECMFDRLKRWRAVATRYGKLQVRYEATVKVAVIDDWIAAVVRTG